MRVNGEDHSLIQPMTVLDLLKERCHDPMRVAVERNGEILSRSGFAETLLSEEDRIEIVAFVGGG